MGKYVPLIIVTIISGIISANENLNDQVNRAMDADVFIVPGAVFGLLVGAYFVTKHKVPVWKAIIWAGFSALAFYLAVMTAISTSGNHNAIISFSLAGLVGSALLLLGTNLLIQRLNITQIFTVLIIGGVMGIAFFFITEFLHSGVLAYVVWQVAVGTALGIFVDRNKKI